MNQLLRLTDNSVRNDGPKTFSQTMRKASLVGGPVALSVILLIGFELATRGQMVEVLHSFNNTNGANPEAGLIQGNDGDFYGTTHFGGAYGKGTAFRLSADSSFATLLSFDGTNGSYPRSGLIQASDGDFYGTTLSGGSGGGGTGFPLAARRGPVPLGSFK